MKTPSTGFGKMDERVAAAVQGQRVEARMIKTISLVSFCFNSC